VLIFVLVAALAACSSAEDVITVVQPVVEERSDEPMAKVEAELGVVSEGQAEISQLAYAPTANRTVIKDAEIELLVRDTDAAIVGLNALVADYGGYILSSNTWFDREYKYASVRLSVPSSSFEKALNELRILGLSVLNETASGQDVTSEYVDLESQLINLEATSERVRQFLESAENVEEALRINQELSALEAQIEQVKGQMRFYEGRSAYSTVTVNLIPERPTPTPTPPPSWNPGDTFEDASKILMGLTQSTVNVLIWIIVVLGPFVALIWGVLWVVRRIYRKWTR
jgi:hypothetical protein